MITFKRYLQSLLNYLMLPYLVHDIGVDNLEEFTLALPINQLKKIEVGVKVQVILVNRASGEIRLKRIYND